MFKHWKFPLNLWKVTAHFPAVKTFHRKTKCNQYSRHPIHIYPCVIRYKVKKPSSLRTPNLPLCILVTWHHETNMHNCRLYDNCKTNMQHAVIWYLQDQYTTCSYMVFVRTNIQHAGYMEIIKPICSIQAIL